MQLRHGKKNEEEQEHTHTHERKRGIILGSSRAIILYIYKLRKHVPRRCWQTKFIRCLLLFFSVRMLVRKHVAIDWPVIDIKHLGCPVLFEVHAHLFDRALSATMMIAYRWDWYVQLNNPKRLYSMWLERRWSEEINCSNEDVIVSRSADGSEQRRDGQRRERVGEPFYVQVNQNREEIVDQV